MTDQQPYPWDFPAPEPLTDETRAEVLAELRELAKVPSGKQWRMQELLHQYRYGLPVVPIARDPSNGFVLEWGIDTFGLDGPYWDYHHPVRPSREIPTTLFAFTGAMQLTQPVPTFSHLAKVGPGAPFVVPRLLAHEHVVAVISEIAVGGNRSWPITYWADPPLLDHHRFNTWGTNGYEWRGPDGDRRWNENVEDAELLDFDLRPWIEAGRLKWIAPGDAKVELRETTRRCPYLGIDGVHAFQRVSFGKVWTQFDDG
ncbi:MAG TPA: hypothetical protein VFV35_07565 [Acidimicrobiales bacterium]|nr:hypothetical protein [Acidimicrobiales bacterium]